MKDSPFRILIFFFILFAGCGQKMVTSIAPLKPEDYCSVFAETYCSIAKNLYFDTKPFCGMYNENYDECFEDNRFSCDDNFPPSHYEQYDKKAAQKCLDVQKHLRCEKICLYQSCTGSLENELMNLETEEENPCFLFLVYKL
jgi:hypothetical protein